MLENIARVAISIGEAPTFGNRIGLQGPGIGKSVAS